MQLFSFFPSFFDPTPWPKKPLKFLYVTSYTQKPHNFILFFFYDIFYPTLFISTYVQFDIDFRCSLWWIFGWILFAVWTTQTINLAVNTIFIVMDLDGIRKISGNNVCDRIHRWILLLHRFDGYTGTCVSHKPHNFDFEMHVAYQPTKWYNQ